jgi:hypothetical protein
MGFTPNHFFMDRIIKSIFSDENIEKHCENKTQTVFDTTGPYMLNQLYNNLTDKEKKQIYLIPPELVSPFDGVRSWIHRKGRVDAVLENSLSEAYAIHYFLGAWIPE